jgi:hypothetical protein
MKSTQGSETSQYLEEEKSSEIPSVAASEGGRAQTRDQIETAEINFSISNLFLISLSDPGGCRTAQVGTLYHS